MSFKISNKEPLFALRSESLRERDGQRIFPTLAALKTVEKLQVARETERERRKKTHIILRGRNDEDNDVIRLRFFAE